MKTRFILAGLLTLFACLVVGNSNAQKKQEFSVALGVGQSSLNYKLNNGDQKNGFGGNLGLNYNYFFSKEWGISTGLEIAMYNSKAENVKDIVETINNLTDPFDNAVFNFKSTVKGYTEKQNAIMLNIPIMALYRLPIAKSNELQFSAGAKIGIPLGGKYKSSGVTFKNVGYYPAIENEADMQNEFMGFGTYANRDINSDAKYNVAVMMAVEAGMIFKLGENKSFYAGLYFDYGLNDIVKEHNKSFLNYKVNKASEFSNNGLLESNNYTDKVLPMAIGVKLRFNLGL